MLTYILYITENCIVLGINIHFCLIDETSSKDFGLKLMLILIRYLKPTDVQEDEMQAIQSLESYLYTVARNNSGQVSKDNFEDYCKDICSVSYFDFSSLEHINYLILNMCVLPSNALPVLCSTLLQYCYGN